MALSIDIRRRVVESYKAREGTLAEIALRFKIGARSVQNWLSLERETGGVRKRPRGGGNPAKIPDADIPKLIELVEEKPDRTNQELADEWNRRMGTDLHRSAMIRSLKRAGLSLKKNRFRTQRGGRHRF